jgi:hypothetical protein
MKDIRHNAATILYFTVSITVDPLFLFNIFFTAICHDLQIPKTGRKLCARDRIMCEWEELAHVEQSNQCILFWHRNVISLCLHLVWWFLSDGDLPQKCNLIILYYIC